MPTDPTSLPDFSSWTTPQPTNVRARWTDTSYDKPATGLSCLGGSSAVEYCSDSVAFLGIDGKGVERRTNMSRPIRPLKLTMLKNRYGTCDETTLLYDAEHATFAEES